MSTEIGAPAEKSKPEGGRGRGRRGGRKRDGGDSPRRESKPREAKTENKDRPKREDKPKRERKRRDGESRGDRERKRPPREASKPSRAKETPGSDDVAAAAPSGPRKSTEASDTEATALLQEMIQRMGIEATVTHAEDEDNNLRLTVSSEDSALLIGRKGRGLAALQYVINRVARDIEGRDESERIIVDVEGYLDRRKQSLEDMALRMADRVKETGRRFRMRPMNPQERRVVHVTLQEDEEIRTFSVGDSAIRSVVIAPKDEEREERPRRRGGRGRGPRREEQAYQDEPAQDGDAFEAHDNGEEEFDVEPEVTKPVETPDAEAPAVSSEPVNDSDGSDNGKSAEPANDADESGNGESAEPADDADESSNGESDEPARPKRRRRTSTYRRTRR